MEKANGLDPIVHSEPVQKILRGLVM
jgi:hypothetical protein